MSGQPKTATVIIPVFNEHESLPTLFERLKQLRAVVSADRYKMNFVIIDDGSGDGSGQMLDREFNGQADVKVIHHPQNRGIGAAIKTGFANATGEFVVTADADTNYDQLEIPRLLDAMTDDTDMVTASPFMPGAGGWEYPFYRYITSWGAKTLYKLVLRGVAIPVHTYTSGFRAYRRSILPNIMPTSDDFVVTAELLVRALVKKYRVKEYPTMVHKRLHGASKLQTFKTIRSHLRLMWRLWRRVT